VIYVKHDICFSELSQMISKEGWYWFDYRIWCIS